MVIAADVKAAELKPKVSRAARTPQGLDQRLAEMLCSNGTLTEQDFKRVLDAQREHGGRFGEAALRLGLVTEMDVRRALARQCELPSMLPDAASFSRQLIVAHQPGSARAEALRGVRSELLLRWFNQGHGTLAVSETRAQQGAATLAANMAWLFAQLGQRTLLIDANLRRPEIQTLFKFDYQYGLADFLRGRFELKDVINSVPGFNQLSIMFAGKRPDNPQELLSLDSFRYLLETVPDEFDAVIVVGPPVLECADMQVIAARAGGCMLNVRRHRTRLGDLERARASLAPTGAPVVGWVLEG
jgi:chain length determinant protein tyrosine kinase EpsG